MKLHSIKTYRHRITRQKPGTIVRVLVVPATAEQFRAAYKIYRASDYLHSIRAIGSDSLAAFLVSSGRVGK